MPKAAPSENTAVERSATLKPALTLGNDRKTSLLPSISSEKLIAYWPKFDITDLKWHLFNTDL